MGIIKWERDLGVVIEKSPKPLDLNTAAMLKANQMLDCISRVNKVNQSLGGDVIVT